MRFGRFIPHLGRYSWAVSGLVGGYRGPVSGAAIAPFDSTWLDGIARTQPAGLLPACFEAAYGLVMAEGQPDGLFMAWSCAVYGLAAGPGFQKNGLWAG